MVDAVIEVIVKGPQGVPSLVAGPRGGAVGTALTFSNVVTDSDPGQGVLRLNNLTPASATQIFVDNTDSSGASITAWLDALDDSTTTDHRGLLTVTQVDDPTKYAIFQVTGSVVDGTGYRKIPVTGLGPAGLVFTDGAALAATFARSGNTGAGSSADGVSFTPVGGIAGDTVQEAIEELDAEKAPKASPALTGTPTAPTASAGTNTNQIATTAFVATAVDNLVGAAPGALNTLSELADAINDDASYAATVTTALALKAPLASPTFTGTPAAPTASPGTNTTQLATTAFATAAATARAAAGANTDITSLAGVTSGVAAAAGRVGEHLIQKNNGGGAAIALVTLTAKTVLSLALTAGDWDVSGMLGILPAATTNVAFAEGSVSLVNDAAANAESGDYAYLEINQAFTAGKFPTLTIPPKQVLISAPTTIYLVARVGFTVSTLSAFGMLRARRMR